jgi:hypothetical protein
MDNSKSAPEESTGEKKGIRWVKGWGGIKKIKNERFPLSFLNLLERVNLHPVFPEVLRFHILNDRF